MNTLKNNVQLIGRLGNNPNLMTWDSGKKSSEFSLATNESYINADGEEVKNTDWHTIKAWGSAADLVEKLLKKGDEVVVTGKLTYRQYEKEGQTHTVAEIMLSEFYKTTARKAEAPK